MKGNWNTRKVVALALVTLLTLLVSTASVGSAAPTIQDATVAITITATRITWKPLIEHGGIVFTISGPDFYLQKEYGSRSRPTFESTDSAGNPLTDGIYVYQLQFMPIGDSAARSSIDAAERGIAPASGEEPLIHAGAFTVAGGFFVVPTIEEDDEDLASTLDGAILAPTDVCYSDDMVVDGSFCVGFDCVCNMTFGFDTIVLKENNLRIFFDDTSTSASFPRNDWRITINDSANGGASYFGIDDATAGRSPFRIEAGAPSHSLYVDDGGRVGLGTSTPVLELDIRDGDTPSIRLGQDGSSGFAPQTWDVAGNETNFFIRDVTSGSKLPFRIRPGAPTSSIDIASSGNVGIGTSSPAAKLDVTGGLRVSSSTANNYWQVGMVDDGTNFYPAAFPGSQTTSPFVFFNKASASTVDQLWLRNNGGSYNGLYIGHNDSYGKLQTTGPTPLALQPTGGNVGIATTSPSYKLHVNGSAGKPGGGSWSDSSDARLKENIEPIDGQRALAVLNQLQGVTFEWINPEEHSAGTQAGLIAQDVEEVFPDWVEEVEPQGNDVALIPAGEKAKAVHLPHDYNAYMIEAVKELDAQNQTLAKTVEEQDAKIVTLEQQNADLEARLTALEEAARGTNNRTVSLPLTGLFLSGLLVVGVVASWRRKQQGSIVPESSERH